MRNALEAPTVGLDQVVELLLGGVRQRIRPCDEPAEVVERHGW
jgi:hypothetical protein